MSPLRFYRVSPFKFATPHKTKMFLIENINHFWVQALAAILVSPVQIQKVPEWKGSRKGISFQASLKLSRSQSLPSSSTSMADVADVTSGNVNADRLLVILPLFFFYLLGSISSLQDPGKVSLVRM